MYIRESVHSIAKYRDCLDTPMHTYNIHKFLQGYPFHLRFVMYMCSYMYITNLAQMRHKYCKHRLLLYTLKLSARILHRQCHARVMH